MCLTEGERGDFSKQHFLAVCVAEGRRVGDIPLGLHFPKITVLFYLLNIYFFQRK